MRSGVCFSLLTIFSVLSDSVLKAFIISFFASKISPCIFNQHMLYYTCMHTAYCVISLFPYLKLKYPELLKNTCTARTKYLKLLNNQSKSESGTQIKMPLGSVSSTLSKNITIMRGNHREIFRRSEPNVQSRRPVTPKGSKMWCGIELHSGKSVLDWMDLVCTRFSAGIGNILKSLHKNQYFRN